MLTTSYVEFQPSFGKWLHLAIFFLDLNCRRVDNDSKADVDPLC